jgi:hypothetical protein
VSVITVLSIAWDLLANTGLLYHKNVMFAMAKKETLHLSCLLLFSPIFPGFVDLFC